MVFGGGHLDRPKSWIFKVYSIPRCVDPLHRSKSYCFFKDENRWVGREKKNISGHIDFALNFFSFITTKNQKTVGLLHLTEERGVCFYKICISKQLPEGAMSKISEVF